MSPAAWRELKQAALHSITNRALLGIHWRAVAILHAIRREMVRRGMTTIAVPDLP